MPKERCFLFLQGPHGPFFDELSRALGAAGCRTMRVGFNGGDARYWRSARTFVPYHGSLRDWPRTLGALINRHGLTDIVLYSDTRPVHAAAIEVARNAGLKVHCFEEGYLRPYWITYERGGANGHSPITSMSMAQVAAAVRSPDAEAPEAPARWGETRRHTWYGARYHFAVWWGRRKFPAFKGHRREPLGKELVLHLKRMVTLPFQSVLRDITTTRLKRLARPYHVALCQLAHDANMQDHSDIGSQRAFVRRVVEGFAQGAQAHHQLVFKAHPLEDGRENLPALVREEAQAHGVADRAWFLHGGKLGPLLDAAHSAITVNSTAAQQAMWRGLPVRAFGRAVYAKPPLVSQQPMRDFFANPDKPDLALYRLFRLFLLETSQVGGGFYSAPGRRAVIRQLVDRMLAEQGPYSRQNFVENATIAPKLRLVAGADLTLGDKQG